MVTTMHSPVDANHPESGNRMFGIKSDPSGGYTFYTIGVDRATDMPGLLWGVFSGGQPFIFADNLWEGLQDEVFDILIPGIFPSIPE